MPCAPLPPSACANAPVPGEAQPAADEEDKGAAFPWSALDLSYAPSLLSFAICGACICYLAFTSSSNSLRLLPAASATFFSTALPGLPTELAAAAAACAGNMLLTSKGETHPPWSVTAAMVSAPAALPTCATRGALLAALRDGERAPAPGAGSFFLPSGCAPAWASAAATCAAAGRYASITLMGDSLARHALMALGMLLSGDWVQAPLPLEDAELPGYQAENCTCDGQFSEVPECRPFDRRIELHTARVCYGGPGWPEDTRVGYESGALNHNISSVVDLCSDARPHAVVFSGGTHYQSSAAVFWSGFLVPALASLAAAAEACATPPQIAWAVTGLNFQSHSYDARYPLQAEGPSRAFNGEIEARLEAALALGAGEYEWAPGLRGSYLGYVDFMAATEQRPGAEPAMSDGFHYAAEVNLVKANALMQLLSLPG